MIYQSIRSQLLDAVIQSNEANLIYLSAGNISARTGDGLVAITAGGVKYRTMTAADISIVDLDGNLVDGIKPSSETPMHTAIYRNMPDVGSIYHTHSPYAITFAMLGDAVPMANTELLVCGAPIPVAPWACPGTSRAGEVTLSIFKERPGLKVILLRKHGLVAVGANLDHAFDMAFNAEVGFRTYYQALLLGIPEPITDVQFAEIRAVYHPE
ncbi:MAG: class II aldolase/adducin family protein [Anaerolineales bacterium]|nr:MAG: class II aldolase/adducin family protein [Anaerolineales bacterium]